VQRLAPGQYEFYFNDDREPVYVLWDAGNGDRVTGALSGEVEVTDLAGNTSDMDAADLRLAASPVFVERK
jgi:hypothetical protein